jgi:hypothetical protein
MGLPLLTAHCYPQLVEWAEISVRPRRRGVEAEDVARGDRGRDGRADGGEHPEREAAGDLLAEAGVDVAELGPLHRVRALQRDHARLRRSHRRRESHVRARLHHVRTVSKLIVVVELLNCICNGVIGVSTWLVLEHSYLFFKKKRNSH